MGVTQLLQSMVPSKILARKASYKSKLEVIYGQAEPNVLIF